MRFLIKFGIGPESVINVDVVVAVVVVFVVVVVFSKEDEGKILTLCTYFNSVTSTLRSK